MNSVFSLIGFIAQLISIYSMLCFIRIILSWIPQFSYSKFAEILGKICDPYLNIFRRLPLHIANLDFSPIIAFIILSGISTILQYIATLQKISLGIILAITFQMIWSAISSILLLFIIILVVRLIVLLMNKDSIGFWSSLDTMIYKLARPVTKLFFKNKFVNLQTAVIIALVSMIILRFLGGFIFTILVNIFQGFPV
ncbi:MAG: YggT family protein [Treponemataceae bacterium]|nr:YggT family protein [Treponemataceae bacterium]